MSRSQKKCLIVSAAMHSVLVLALLFGPAFLVSEKKSSDLPLLTIIPAKLVDAALSGGGNPNAAPPPAKLVQQTPQTPVSLPKPPPKQPAGPKQTVSSKKTVPETPSEEKRAIPEKPEAKRPAINLTKTERRKPANTETRAAEETRQKREAAAEARRATELAKAREAAINNSLESLSKNLNGSTSIEPLGPGGPAYANYAQALISLFADAWLPPENLEDDLATVQAKVTIASDGRVVKWSLTKRSNKAALDKSVEKALDRVRAVPPFPEGSKEAERTFTINFNLKAKRLLG
jgi:TonB family protein